MSDLEPREMTVTDAKILALADKVSPRMRIREYDENLLAFARAAITAALSELGEDIPEIAATLAGIIENRGR